jgi:hypothetical protein
MNSDSAVASHGGQSLRGTWSGEVTQARRFIVVVAASQFIALALRLRPHTPAMAVCLEVETYCLRGERVAPSSLATLD